MGNNPNKNVMKRSQIQSEIQAVINKERERARDGHDIYSKREVLEIIERFQAINDETDWDSPQHFDFKIIKEKLVDEVTKTIEDFDYDVDVSISSDGENKIETEVRAGYLVTDVAELIREYFDDLQNQPNNDRQME